MTYYDYTDYISNSDLGAFKKQLYGIDPLPNLQQIYDFGNLVDALSLERHRVNLQARTVEGINRVFFDDEIQKGLSMARALEADKSASFMLKCMKKQYAYFRSNFKINYDGYEFTVKAKCKFDGILKHVLGADIKTTACKKERDFIGSFDFFDYDRQAAWYMDQAEIDRMIYIGISKCEKPKIFKVAVDRSGEIYKAGRAKYEKLAFHYKHLILDF